MAKLKCSNKYNGYSCIFNKYIVYSCISKIYTEPEKILQAISAKKIYKCIFQGIQYSEGQLPSDRI